MDISGVYININRENGNLQPDCMDNNCDEGTNENDKDGYQ